MKKSKKIRIYSLSEGLGINNEDSYLLLSNNVITKYYPKSKYSKEEFIRLANELINELKRNN